MKTIRNTTWETKLIASGGLHGSDQPVIPTGSWRIKLVDNDDPVLLIQAREVVDKKGTLSSRALWWGEKNLHVVTCYTNDTEQVPDDFLSVSEEYLSA